MTPNSPSGRIRSLLTSTDFWLGLLVTLLAVAVCVSLGRWQWQRYEGKRDRAAVIEANYDADPVSLDSILPTPDAPLAAPDDWTLVHMQGSYCADPECVLYVRNRPQDGDVGFWQVAPFTTNEGFTVFVVRGWVPMRDEVSEPYEPPPVPAGEMTITAHVRPAEPSLQGRESVPGQVQSVSPPELIEASGMSAGSTASTVYAQLNAENPSVERPAALPQPDTGLGPHLSYAFQWWIFAGFFVVGFIVLTRRKLTEHDPDEEKLATTQTAPPVRPIEQAPNLDELTAEAEGTSAAASQGSSAAAKGPLAANANRAHSSARPARRRKPTRDEQEEDALIDQGW